MCLNLWFHNFYECISHIVNNNMHLHFVHICFWFKIIYPYELKSIKLLQAVHGINNILCHILVIEIFFSNHIKLS